MSRRPSRREWLVGAGAGLGALALSSRAQAAVPTRAKPPTAFIQIFLHGGIDAILTTNPRRRQEVAAKVDLPYEESQIVSRGSLRAGPLLAPLSPVLDQIAVLNGVLGFSLAHKSASDNIRQMRSAYPTDNGISLATTIGAHLRGDRPLDNVVLGPGYSVAAGYRPMGRVLAVTYAQLGQHTLLHQLWKLGQDPAKRDLYVRILAGELSGASVGAREAIATAEQLLRHAPAVAPGAPVAMSPDCSVLSPALASSEWLRHAVPGFAQQHGIQLRDAIYALRHDLTRSVYLDFQWNFDSHGDNFDVQSLGIAFADAMVLSLLEELTHIPGAHGGTLRDETLIVISSELGRFPMLNAGNGKDHFPEFPVMFIGGGVRPGQYGDTDQLMTAQPISFTTGRPSHSSSDQVPTIDDLGFTLLDRFGVRDPRSRGYVGRRLDFLFS
jgi:hypothetical protein